jgi:hypothetical protein
MNRFLQQHARLVSGMLSGWDRLRFRGTLPNLCHAGGLGAFFHATKRMFKQFREFALSSSTQLKETAVKVAERLGRPVIYLPSSKISKEEVAKQCAKDDGITDGLICCITSLEPCSSFGIGRDPIRQRIDFMRRQRKCLHIYHYYQHPIFGFMHVRFQSWLPFDQFICINGREWLGRMLDAARIHYLRKENCFLQIDDVEAAQRMLDEQVTWQWKPALDQIATWIAPDLQQILAPYLISYYWTIAESEWATDVAFRSRSVLEEWYGRWVRHAFAN